MELGCEGVRRDLPVLSTEVSDLARCGLYGVTGWILAADEGIETIVIQRLIMAAHAKDATA